VQLVQVLSEVEDGAQLFVDELAYLRSPLVVRTDEAHVNLSYQGQLLPSLSIPILFEELLVDQRVRLSVSELLAYLDFNGLKQLPQLRVYLQYVPLQVHEVIQLDPLVGVSKTSGDGSGLVGVESPLATVLYLEEPLNEEVFLVLCNSGLLESDLKGEEEVEEGDVVLLDARDYC
jgi:hypothetical protein